MTTSVIKKIVGVFSLGTVLIFAATAAAQQASEPGNFDPATQAATAAPLHGRQGRPLPA